MTDEQRQQVKDKTEILLSTDTQIRRAIQAIDTLMGQIMNFHNTTQTLCQQGMNAKADIVQELNILQQNVNDFYYDVMKEK